MASNDNIWIEISFRWWARWLIRRPFCWIWKAVGYIPSWVLKVRSVPPPRV